MIRQYYAPRRRGGNNPLGVGVITIGSIYYLQDHAFWRNRTRAICRNPWIVEAFLNGTLAAANRNRLTGHWEDRYISGRSDMAIVRSLRNGRRQTVPVRILSLHDDLCLSKEPTNYPTLPLRHRASIRNSHHAKRTHDTAVA